MGPSIVTALTIGERASTPEGDPTSNILSALHEVMAKVERNRSRSALTLAIGAAVSAEMSDIRSAQVKIRQSLLDLDEYVQKILQHIKASDNPDVEIEVSPNGNGDPRT